MQREIAIDFGTANTVIFVVGKGIIIREPSLIAIDSVTNDIITVGKAAKDMIGRNPGNIKVLSPIKNGVVADMDLCVSMLKAMLKKHSKHGNFNKSKMIMSFPVNATEVEKAALHEVGIHAGGKDVSLLCAPVAALLCQGVSPKNPKAQMIINMGAGHTGVAVCSFGEVISCYGDRGGGNDINESIIRYMKVKYKLQISDSRAEDIKLSMASVYPLESEMNNFIDVKGRDISDNLPRSITISSDELRDIIRDEMSPLLRAIAKTCENLSAQVSADVLDGEVILTGGASQIKGLKEYIKEIVGFDCILSETPKDDVANGLGHVFQG